MNAPNRGAARQGLRITVDEALIAGGNYSGIGHHAVGLWEELQKTTDVVVAQHRVLRKIPRIVRRFAYFASANIRALISNRDVTHHLSHYVPLLSGRGRKVVTIYDLSVLRFPESIPPFWRGINRRMIPRALKRADRIITISDAVRNELLEEFPWADPERIIFCPCGLRRVFIEDRKSSVPPSGLEPFSYFLALGDLTARKNLRFALTAFLQAKKQGTVDTTTRLVLVGKRGWGYGDIHDLIREENGIIHLGYVGEEELPGLYRNAKALIFPSLYEGFGIPLIEAMSQQTLILCSKIPTNIELNDRHGKQMQMFDLDVQEGFLRLLGTIDRQWRDMRARLDYGDLSRYDYRSIAREHLAIYESVCRG